MHLLQNFLTLTIMTLGALQCFGALSIGCVHENAHGLQVQRYNRNEYAEFKIDMDNYVAGQTEKEFKSKIINYGFVVLLNAIPSSKIDEMYSLLSKTYEYAEEDDTLDAIEKQNVRSSHISEQVFQKFNSGRSLFEVFDDKLCKLGGYFFSGTFRINEGTHTRRVKPHKCSDLKYFQAPIGIHIDAMFHGPREFVLNFWTPLEDCGIDKPTLLTFMSSCTNTLSLMKFDKKRFIFDPEVSESVWQGTAPFLKELPSYYFVVNKGDIVVISNWTLHSGYANEQMEYPRTSMELRISGNSFWYN